MKNFHRVKRATAILTAAALFSLPAAQAVTVATNGDLSALKRVGGNSFDSTGFVSADPSSWPYMDKDIGVAGNQPNSALVFGNVTVVGGIVTAATIKMYSGEVIQLGTYQTAATTSNLRYTDATWTYNPLGVAANGSLGTLTHTSQGTGGINASCVPVAGGPAVTGQCSSFRTATNAANANSFALWDGVAANFIVVDNLASPANNFTPSSIGGVPNYNASGAAGLNAIVWDLSGFNESTGEGTIKAAVALTTQTGNNATVVTGVYTLQAVPVPAAVWLFGSALGVMGIARRRRAAAA
jgi:hypothetical protein